LRPRRAASSVESGDASSPPSAVAAADADASAAARGGVRWRPRGRGLAGKARVLGNARADGLGRARRSGDRGQGEVRMPYISPLLRRRGSGKLKGLGRKGVRAAEEKGGSRKAKRPWHGTKRVEV